MHADSLRPHTPRAVDLADALAGLGIELRPAHGDDPTEVATLAVTGVALSGDAVQPGDLFLAVPGARRHGAKFAAQAADRGARAILTDDRGVELTSGLAIPVLRSPVDPRTLGGTIASRVYGTDTARPLTLGITGTNGKTSTAHILEAILGALGQRTGISSTAERRIGTEVIASHLTTPEAPELHGLLARMRERAVDSVILEVSAHALSRHRVDGVRFDVAAFTNLSHDHLDDYADMDSYLAAKQELFTPERSSRAVVCLDSPAGAQLAAEAKIPVTTIARAERAAAAGADWLVEIGEESPGHTAFTLRRRDGSVPDLPVVVTLLGAHMAANAALALVMLLDAGVPRTALEEAVAGGIRVGIPGRLVRLTGGDGPDVFLDAGHTPDAIRASLEALRRVTPGRVIIVLGADGGRDPSKREPMGAEAARHADVLVLADHHQREEDPAAIRAALASGARSVRPEVEIHDVGDPDDAIRTAVGLARVGDSILWPGLASQNYRAVGTQELPYSVADAARRALRASGWSVSD